jgi:hypothetical protein
MGVVEDERSSSVRAEARPSATVSGRTEEHGIQSILVSRLCVFLRVSKAGAFAATLFPRKPYRSSIWRSRAASGTRARNAATK